MLTLPPLSTVLALAAFIKYEKLQLEAGEMVQLVNFLPDKHKFRSTAPSKSHAEGETD